MKSSLPQFSDSKRCSEASNDLHFWVIMRCDRLLIYIEEGSVEWQAGLCHSIALHYGHGRRGVSWHNLTQMINSHCLWRKKQCKQNFGARTFLKRNPVVGKQLSGRACLACMSLWVWSLETLKIKNNLKKMSYQRFPEIPEKRPFTYKQLLCLLKCIIFSYLGRIIKIYISNPYLSYCPKLFCSFH